MLINHSTIQSSFIPCIDRLPAGMELPETSGTDMARLCEASLCATMEPHPNQPHLPLDAGASSSTGEGSSGVSDTVALNLEVNTSALNINGGSPGHTPRPKDFLDLMDTTPPDWNSSPSRPRMFPHKLY